MPVLAAPPGVLFTLQVTAVFVVFVTSAENARALPRSTNALAGVTFTFTEEGGGGGGGATGPAPPPPQPSVHALAVRRTAERASRCLGRVGTLWRKQAKGQRKQFRPVSRRLRACRAYGEL